MRRFTILCLLFGLAAFAGAQTPIDSEWSAHTSMGDVQDLLLETTDVWAATTGGVLRYERFGRRYQRYTRLDGLAGNRTLAVAADADGDLWFGTDGQGLSRFRRATSTFDPPFLEFRDLTISSLLSAGNRLYVGTNRGVSVFLIDKEEVKETYRLMGHLPKDSAARALAIDDGTLYVGTPDGVAWADLELPNLQDPDSWFSTSSTGPIVDAIAVNGNVHVASQLGVYTYRALTNRFFHDYQDTSVLSLGERAGRAIAATAGGDFMARQSVGRWLRIGAPIITGANALSRSRLSQLWIGTEDGLRVVGQEPPAASGEPGSSRFYEIALAGDDELWATSVPNDQQRSLSAGCYRLIDGSWTVYRRSTGMPNDELVALETDRRGRMWVGSWGGGVAIREPGETWTFVSNGNSILQGVPNGPSFVVISDIQRDGDGHMWLLNELAGVAVMDDYPPTQELLIDQVALGLNPLVDLYRMDIGPDGLKWIASRTHGLVLLDDGGTPFTAEDDRMVVVNQAVESRLTSNLLFDVLVDGDGRVWMASNNGINVLTPDYDRASGTLRHEAWRVYTTFDGLPSNEINTFEIDDNGNLWVGTEGGLARIGADGETDLIFTQSNSGLIDNRIKGLTFDPDRGELWIGTFDGLNRLRLVGTSEPGDPEGLTVFPNPFVTAGRQSLTFAGLPLGSRLRIYNVAGDLVAAVQADPGRGTVSWQGINEAGFLVASGIYYYVAEGEGGDRVDGRFAVVGGPTQ